MNRLSITLVYSLILSDAHPLAPHIQYIYLFSHSEVGFSYNLWARFEWKYYDEL